MSTNYVRAWEAPTEYQAVAVNDLLLDSGIASHAIPFARDYIGILAGSSVMQSWGEVLVPQEDYEKALELIGGFLGTMGMLAELSLEELETAALAEDGEKEIP